MADMTITVDNAALLAALGALGAAVETFTLPAAKVTADNIQREALARVARRTGQTAEGIIVRPLANGQGYEVDATNARMPNLPLWLEFGTKQGKKKSHASPARPFLFVSSALEAGAHDQRMREAVQSAIDSVGLGE